MCQRREVKLGLSDSKTPCKMKISVAIAYRLLQTSQIAVTIII